MRALIAVAALLALAGPAFATLGDNGMATYSGRKREPNTLVFGNEMVVEMAAQSTLNFAGDLLKGVFKPTPNMPATEKKELKVSCLNSVAPPPLNWKMWCPDKDAKVLQWTDKSGAMHRQITLRPQAGMTSTMYIWWIISHLVGLMPPVVEFQGNHYWYYHLWHPLDHVESAWKMGPKNPLTQKGFPIYALIHERYRNPKGFKSDHHYETNGWFYADDSLANLLKNRFVITMPLMGVPTFSMILEFNDTPQGLVVDVEMIAGLPHKGYDERSPHRGYLTAAGLNEMAMAPLMARNQGNFDWNEAFDAITRHVVEEFSNLQFFVPYFWQKYTVLGKAGVSWIPTLGTWLQKQNLSPADSASISFYHALVALASKQINISNTTHAAAAVDALVAKTNATYRAKTAAATAAVVAKSQVYVPASNAVTAANKARNAANGAHPEAINTYHGVTINKKGDAAGINATTRGGNAGHPLAGVKAFMTKQVVAGGNASKVANVKVDLTKG